MFFFIYIYMIIIYNCTNTLYHIVAQECRGVSGACWQLVVARCVRVGMSSSSGRWFQGPGWRLGDGAPVPRPAAPEPEAVVRPPDPPTNNILDPLLPAEQRESIIKDLHSIKTVVTGHLEILAPEHDEHRGPLIELAWSVDVLCTALRDDSYADMQRIWPEQDWLSTNVVLLQCSVLGSEFKRLQSHLPTLAQAPTVVNVDEEPQSSSEYVRPTQEYRSSDDESPLAGAQTPDLRPSGGMQTPEVPEMHDGSQSMSVSDSPPKRRRMTKKTRGPGEDLD